MPIKSEYEDCLTNFKDEFVFLFTDRGSYRYSLAEDKLEELPRLTIEYDLSACSLGDKVYVSDLESCAIKVLHNPDAPVSSQEMHWQDIELPGDISFPWYYYAFVPLNSTEIAIAGGLDQNGKTVADVTLDTTTCEFKKEVVNRDPFTCYKKQSANFCENTFIALVVKGDSYHVLKYTKGDTSATVLYTF